MTAGLLVGAVIASLNGVRGISGLGDKGKASANSPGGCGAAEASPAGIRYYSLAADCRYRLR